MSQEVALKYQATTGNANQAAESTQPEIDIAAMVQRIASIKIKCTKQGDSTMKERFTLNREKLINACRSEWKSKRAHEKTERVPDEIDSKLVEYVDSFIQKQLAQVNILNALNFTRKIVPDFRNDQMVENVLAKGRNLLKLEEQRLFNDIARRETEEHLSRIQSKPNPDYDLETKVKEKIEKLRKMGLWIQTQIEDQATLTAK